VVCLLIVQLLRISLVKILVVLLASTKFEKGDTILFNASYSFIKLDLDYDCIEELQVIFLLKISSSLALVLEW